MKNLNKQLVLEKYKYITIAIHCITIYIMYTKDFFKFSNSFVGEFSDRAMQFFYNSSYYIGDGRLGLTGFYDFLKTITDDGLISLGEAKFLLDAFRIWINICFVIAIVELVFLLCEVGVQWINSLYVSSQFLLMGFILLWCHKFSGMDEDYGEATLRVTVSIFACIILSILTSALWHSRKKIGSMMKYVKDGETAEEDTSERDKSENGVWRKYYENNKDVLLLTFMVFLMEYLIYKHFPSYYYSSSCVIMRTASESILVGIAVVYANCGSLRYLFLLALLSVISKVIYFGRGAQYFSIYAWMVNILHMSNVCLLLGAENIFLKEKKKKIYIMLCTALSVWTLLRQLLEMTVFEGKIYLNFNYIDLLEILAVLLPVMFFIEDRRRFIRILHIREPSFQAEESSNGIIRRVVEKTKIKYVSETIICPNCQKRIKDPKKYCIYCGAQLRKDEE